MKPKVTSSKSKAASSQLKTSTISSTLFFTTTIPTTTPVIPLSKAPVKTKSTTTTSTTTATTTTTTVVKSASSCSGCCPGWKQYKIGSKNRCLKYMGRKKAQDGASTCAALNAKLPLPRSDEENKDYLAAFRQMVKYASGFAIDLNDVKQEGNFVTSTGEKPTYFNWSGVVNRKPEHSGPLFEPNNGCCYNGNNWAGSMGENYVELRNYALFTMEKDKWNDVSATTMVYTVCEK